jgi:polar amino acid transport system permease protein
MISSSFLQELLPHLLQGTLVSLKIAFFSWGLGFLFGTVLGIVQSGNNSILRACITAYVTLFRGTPMLIQIFFMTYILPVLGIDLSLITTAIIAIGLNSSAYVSQIIKTGIKSIDKGQFEAGKVLGFSYMQTMYYIIFPQVIRVIIPALLNEGITLIKDTSLASTIGVPELFKEGTIVISRTYNAIPVYCAIAIIYLVLTTLLSLGVARYERKMNIHVTH